MKKLLTYALPVALMAAQGAGATPSGWGGIATRDLGAANAATDDAPLVLAQYRRGGGGAHVNGANVNRANINRTNVKLYTAASGDQHLVGTGRLRGGDAKQGSECCVSGASVGFGC